MTHFNHGSLAEHLTASGPFTAREVCALVEGAVLSRSGNILSDLERTVLMMAASGRSAPVIAGTLRRSQRAVHGALKTGLSKLIGARWHEARESLHTFHNRTDRDRRIIGEKQIGEDEDGEPVMEPVYLETSNGGDPEHMGHPDPVVAFDLLQPLTHAAAVLTSA